MAILSRSLPQTTHGCFRWFCSVRHASPTQNFDSGLRPFAQDDSKNLIFSLSAVPAGSIKKKQPVSCRDRRPRRSKCSGTTKCRQAPPRPCRHSRKSKFVHSLPPGGRWVLRSKSRKEPAMAMPYNSQKRERRDSYACSFRHDFVVPPSSQRKALGTLSQNKETLPALPIKKKLHFSSHPERGGEAPSRSFA